MPKIKCIRCKGECSEGCAFCKACVPILELPIKTLRMTIYDLTVKEFVTGVNENQNSLSEASKRVHDYPWELVLEIAGKKQLQINVIDKEKTINQLRQLIIGADKLIEQL